MFSHFRVVGRYPTVFVHCNVFHNYTLIFFTNRVGNVFTCSYCWQVPKPTLYDFEPFLRLTGSWGVEKWKKDYAGDWVCEICVDAAC